jgi:hypothetical protein
MVSAAALPGWLQVFASPHFSRLPSLFYLEDSPRTPMGTADSRSSFFYLGDTPSGLTQADDLVMLVERIASAIRPATAPLAHWEELEKAVAHNWLLTSGDVKRVIGVKPKGESFPRGSFTFIRSGTIGNQTAWRVVKSSSEL